MTRRTPGGTLGSASGTGLKDRVGNARDEVCKDLGNVGDAVRKARRELRQ